MSWGCFISFHIFPNDSITLPVCTDTQTQQDPSLAGLRGPWGRSRDGIDTSYLENMSCAPPEGTQQYKFKHFTHQSSSFQTCNPWHIYSNKKIFLKHSFELFVFAIAYTEVHILQTNWALQIHIVHTACIGFDWLRTCVRGWLSCSRCNLWFWSRPPASSTKAKCSM